MENTTEFVSSPDIHDIGTRFALQSAARELLPEWRVGMCMRHKQQRGGNVEVRYNHQEKKAWYAGLFRCASGWVCAFCSYKIAEQRRRELSTALLSHLNEYTPFLVTYTIKHDVSMSLAPTLSSMLDAFRYMKRGRDWRLYKSEASLVGSVRSLEITHGSAGWHPHIHELVLINTEHLRELGTREAGEGEGQSSVKIDWLGAMQQMGEWMSEQLARHYWKPALETLGLTCDIVHGVQVTHSHETIIEYIVKFGHEPLKKKKGWSVESELTGANVKVGRGENRTPFTLLYDAMMGDEQSGILFVEYAQATFGRSQVQWTPGLKNLLGIVDVDDDSAADAELEQYETLVEITSEQWRRILKHNLRARVLEIARTGDKEQVMEYLLELPE